jgi:hypothetical protein
VDANTKSINDAFAEKHSLINKELDAKLRLEWGQPTIEEERIQKWATMGVEARNEALEDLHIGDSIDRILTSIRERVRANRVAEFRRQAEGNQNGKSTMEDHNTQLDSEVRQ